MNRQKTVAIAVIAIMAVFVAYVALTVRPLKQVVPTFQIVQKNKPKVEEPMQSEDCLKNPNVYCKG